MTVRLMLAACALGAMTALATGASRSRKSRPTTSAPRRSPHPRRGLCTITNRRVVDIPMRDGVKLHTVILIPERRGVRPGILLTRTPYNAEQDDLRSRQPDRSYAALPDGPDSGLPMRSSAARLYPRVPGRARHAYGSQGHLHDESRACDGTPYNPTKTDDSTDAYDTIDWLVKKANLPESNGKRRRDPGHQL